MHSCLLRWLALFETPGAAGTMHRARDRAQTAVHHNVHNL